MVEAIEYRLEVYGSMFFAYIALALEFLYGLPVEIKVKLHTLH
jgi:hypothetical protein